MSNLSTTNAISATETSLLATSFTLIASTTSDGTSQPVPPTASPSPTQPPIANPTDPSLQANNVTSVIVPFTAFVLGGAAIFSAFCFLRTRLPFIYQPRRRILNEPPPKLTNAFYGWIAQLIRIPEELVMRTAGTDSLFILRFLRSSFMLFSTLSILGLSILTPLNASGNEVERNPRNETLKNPFGFDEVTLLRRISFENVSPGSSAIDAHIVMLWVVEILVYINLRWFYRECINTRIQRVKHDLAASRTDDGSEASQKARARNIDLRTVMMVNLPDHMRDEVIIKRFWEEDAGVGKVEKVAVCRRYVRLRRMIAERFASLRAIEMAWVGWRGNLPKTLEGIFDKARDRGTRVDMGQDDPFVSALSNADLEVLEEVLRRGFTDALTGPMSPTAIHPDDDEEGQPRSRRPAFPNSTDSDEETANLITPASTSRPLIRTGFLGLFGPKVDAIGYHFDRYKKIDSRIREFRSQLDDSKPTPYAFVTFADAETAAIAAQCVVPSDPVAGSGWRVVPAPHPREIHWPSISSFASEAQIMFWRTALTIVILVALVFFWSYPITAISNLLRPDALVEVLPPDWAKWVASWSDGTKLAVQTMVPSILVAIWMALLPPVMILLSYLQGIESYSWIDQSCLNKFFFYSIFNVLLVFTVSGSVTTSLDDIIGRPKEIPTLLAKNLTGIAPFFINFICLNAFIQTPILMLFPPHIIPMMFIFLVRKFRNCTPRLLSELTVAPHLTNLNLGLMLVAPLMVSVIALVFSTIQPLILPAAAIFFVIAFIVMKYQLLYMNFVPYETRGGGIGAGFGGMIVKRVIAGQLLHILLMIGALSLKGAGNKAVPAGMTLFVVILISWWWLESTWGRWESNVSLVAAKQSPRKVVQPAWTEPGVAAAATARSMSVLDRIGALFTGGAGNGFLTTSANKPYHLSDPTSSEEAGARAAEPDGPVSSSAYRYGIDVDLDLDGEIDLDDENDPNTVYVADHCTNFAEPVVSRIDGILNPREDPLKRSVDPVKSMEDDPIAGSYVHPARIGRLPGIWLPGFPRTVHFNEYDEDPAKALKRLRESGHTEEISEQEAQVHREMLVRRATEIENAEKNKGIFMSAFSKIDEVMDSFGTWASWLLR